MLKPDSHLELGRAAQTCSYVLVVMNSTILAVAASRSLTQGRSTWPSDALVADITITFAVDDNHPRRHFLAGAMATSQA
jgi:hypothetical protein